MSLVSRGQNNAYFEPEKNWTYSLFFPLFSNYETGFYLLEKVIPRLHLLSHVIIFITQSVANNNECFLKFLIVQVCIERLFPQFKKLVALAYFHFDNLSFNYRLSVLWMRKNWLPLKHIFNLFYVSFHAFFQTFHIWIKLNFKLT
jgi:hypothetical protein